MSNYNFEYLSRSNPELIEASEFNFYVDKPLSVKAYDSALVISKELGGPGIFCGGNYVGEHYFHASRLVPNRISDKLTVDFRDEEVVYVGTFINTWGHCLTDNLKHFWFMDDKRYSYLKKLKFIYTMVYGDASIHPRMLDLLSKIGVGEDKLHRIDGAVRFSRVYIPDHCFLFDKEHHYYKEGFRYYTKEYRDIIGKLIANTKMIPGPEKIYVTRSSWTKNSQMRGRDYGETAVEEFFRSLGYEIIMPEKLSLDEQISMFHNCRSFASTQGSISLNAVFCKKGTDICIIDKQHYKNTYINQYQLAVNHLISGNITHIDANRSSMNDRNTPWNGPFFIYPSKELCAFGGVKYPGFPYLSYLRYLYQARMAQIRGRIKRIASNIIRTLNHDQKKNT